jgi:hypothetical protein
VHTLQCFAYQETVKQLAKNRSYRPDEVERVTRVEEPLPYWRRLWVSLRRNLGFA